MYDSLALILYVVEDNPELLILMPQPPKCCAYRQELRYQAMRC